MRTIAPVLLVVVTFGPSAAVAQQSASFQLTEHVFNAGGHPEQGTTFTSASFRVSLDAIGEDVTLLGAASAGFEVDSGFSAGYPPPGEVSNLRFTDDATLIWDPEPSTGSYNLYRDLVSNVIGLAYGSCEQPDMGGEETTTDGGIPPSADGYFYLVTAENLLDEEGTKGFDSAATERPTPAPCP